MSGVTPTSSCASPSAQQFGFALKYASYCLTGFPLLLSTVLPLTIQRNGPPVASGSACARVISTVPEPSEHAKAICSGLGGSLIVSDAECRSREALHAPAGRSRH